MLVKNSSQGNPSIIHHLSLRGWKIRELLNQWLNQLVLLRNLEFLLLMISAAQLFPISVWNFPDIITELNNWWLWRKINSKNNNLFFLPAVEMKNSSSTFPCSVTALLRYQWEMRKIRMLTCILSVLNILTRFIFQCLQNQFNLNGQTYSTY